MAVKCSVIFFFLLCVLKYSRGELCPKKCDCDMNKGLNRATCVDQNIISVDVGVPKAVQVYSLSRNVISELDNFCFKEAGYLSLEILDLSYNLIFWIGLHAFSGLDKLVHLDLSNNRLRYIPSDLFWDTPKLTFLDLSFNIFETLKNEPILMHTSLQVLSLNNCRIKSLPDRLFTRLPNLKKLDLSENYVVTLSTQVLAPLRKLDRIELRSDYLKCTQDFITVESWIASRGIAYQKYCTKRTSNMFEKIIAAPKIEKEEVDVNNVWNMTKPVNNVTSVPETPLTPFEKFDKDFSAVQAFIIGLELGLAFGVVMTYIWLRKFCKCGQLNCSRDQSRRRNRRLRRLRDSDMRASLLWNTVITPDSVTPPTFRRQMSMPDRNQVPTYGVPVVREAGLRVDAIRVPRPARSETPPPPYNECRITV
ncbi:hypothetical protein ACJJTC_012776 [Scirpophaga incertulas]